MYLTPGGCGCGGGCGCDCGCGGGCAGGGGQLGAWFGWDVPSVPEPPPGGYQFELPGGIDPWEVIRGTIQGLQEGDWQRLLVDLGGALLTGEAPGTGDPVRGLPADAPCPGQPDTELVRRFLSTLGPGERAELDRMYRENGTAVNVGGTWRLERLPLPWNDPGAVAKQAMGGHDCFFTERNLRSGFRDAFFSGLAQYAAAERAPGLIDSLPGPVRDPIQEGARNVAIAEAMPLLLGAGALFLLLR